MADMETHDDNDLEMPAAGEEDGAGPAGGNEKMVTEAVEDEGEDDTKEETATAKQVRKGSLRSDEEKEVQASLPKLENYRAAWLGINMIVMFIMFGPPRRMRAAKVMPYWSRRECGVIRKATPETKQAQVCWAMGFEGELPLILDMLPECSLKPGGSLHHCQANWDGSHLERACGAMCARGILVLIS